MSSHAEATFLPLGPCLVEPDETITSWLDRAAALHGVSRVHILQELESRGREFDGERRASQDFDYDFDMPFDWCRTLERAAGLATGALSPLPASKQNTYLAPESRHAYCALCFEEDLSRGVLPHFRANWSKSSVTLCYRHRCPLHTWKLPPKDYQAREYPPKWLAALFGLPYEGGQGPIESFLNEIIGHINNLERADPSGQMDMFGFQENISRLKKQTRLAHPDRSLRHELIGHALLEGGEGGHLYSHLEYFSDFYFLPDRESYISFEEDLNEESVGKKSVLARLGRGNWHRCVQDLYTLYVTPRAVEISAILPGHAGRSFNAADRWIFEFQEKTFIPVDWKHAHSPTRRRIVLSFINDRLRELFTPEDCTFSSRKRSDYSIFEVISQLRSESREWAVAAAKKWPPAMQEKILHILPEIEESG
ncbi:TniQ family protein [Solimonas marina]|uniref:TniQ domain-containing protein n=1 Tax=Solimonas marina TaxID=2714601 RepID=A0A969WE24_9GAMM|nr:TniQ family protein [Solimonas marina]NKF24385.1 hypothetical protein [Solimonas marina]